MIIRNKCIFILFWRQVQAAISVNVAEKSAEKRYKSGMFTLLLMTVYAPLVKVFGQTQCLKSKVDIFAWE
ncbi:MULTISPECIES: hypothetical protein [Enterobacterales]|uniref:hypothetical protein n=1 Tax=Enterobacterales TaxID=91347 RepID=UPI002EDA8C00